MGIGTGILNALGRSLDSQYRREFEVLARAAFAAAPINTVERSLGMFSRGGIIEALVMQGVSRKDAEEGGEFEVGSELRRKFDLAKADGPGSQSDWSARAMATLLAAAFAKGGPVIAVAALSEAFKEIRNRNFVMDGVDTGKLWEEVLERAASRSPYLQDKYDEMT
jgi:hypothetical protein